MQFYIMPFKGNSADNVAPKIANSARIAPAGAGEDGLKLLSVDLFTHFFDIAEYDPARPLRFGDLEVQVVPMCHIGSGFEPLDGRSKAFGTRITDGESVLAYTGDTGDHPGLDVLARDAVTRVHSPRRT